MQLFADLHTHTIFSHGKGTIEENVQSAIKKGLKQIAITDHGLRHIAYGLNMNKLKQMRAEIDMLKLKYPQIEILLGVEANIISHNGDIDVSDEAKKYLDIVIVGFHQAGMPKNLSAFFKFFLPNCLKIKTKKQIQRNTTAYIKMLEKYSYITAVTHLHYSCAVDAVRVANECLKHNVYVELNGKRTLFSESEISQMVQNNVKFIINSDAHTSENVGNITHPFNVALINRIPKQLIENIDNMPQIKNIT